MQGAQELDRLFEALDRLIPRRRAIMELLYGTGIRVSECERLDLPGVDLAQGRRLRPRRQALRHARPGQEHPLPRAHEYVRNQRTEESAYFDYFPGDNNQTTVLNKPDQARLDEHASLTINTNEAQEQAIITNIKAFEAHPEKYNFTITGSSSESTCVTQCTNLLSNGGLGEFYLRKPESVWNAVYQQYGDPKKDGKHPQPGHEYGRGSSDRRQLDEKASPPHSLRFDANGKQTQ